MMLEPEISHISKVFFYLQKCWNIDYSNAKLAKTKVVFILNYFIIGLNFESCNLVLYITWEPLLEADDVNPCVLPSDL